MWFIYFYAISTILSLIMLFIIIKSVDKKIKRKWNCKYEKESFVETCASLLPFFVPFINCFMILVLIFQQDKIFERYEKKLKEHGAIPVSYTTLTLPTICSV